MLTGAEKFLGIPGEELEAVVRGRTIRVGSVTFLRRVDAGGAPFKAANMPQLQKQFGGEGKFVVYVAVNSIFP